MQLLGILKAEKQKFRYDQRLVGRQSKCNVGVFSVLAPNLLLLLAAHLPMGKPLLPHFHLRFQVKLISRTDAIVERVVQTSLGPQCGFEMGICAKAGTPEPKRHNLGASTKALWKTDFPNCKTG